MTSKWFGATEWWLCPALHMTAICKLWITKILFYSSLFSANIQFRYDCPDSSSMDRETDLLKLSFSRWFEPSCSSTKSIVLFTLLSLYYILSYFKGNETEFGKVLARIQRFSKTSIEFNLSLVYEPEDYLRLLIELHNAKQKVANKRRETRRRIFAK